MYNVPCKFFTKGYCRNGPHCQFMHIIHCYPHLVPCPDYWDCEDYRCICRHPTDQEWYEREEREAEEQRRRDEKQRRKAERERRKEVKRTKNHLKKLRKRARRLEAEQNTLIQQAQRQVEIARQKQEAEERKRNFTAKSLARKLFLVSNFEGWKAYAAQEISRFKSIDEASLAQHHQTLQALSFNFAEAIKDTIAFSPSNHPRLSNGRFAPNHPRLHISDNYDFIKMVWIECLISKQLWVPAGKWRSAESLFALFETTKPWNEESQAFLDTFRNVFIVLSRYSDITSLNHNDFVKWLWEDLGIATPQVVIPLLRYGFAMKNSDILKYGSQLRDNALSAGSNFHLSPANYMIIFDTFSYEDVSHYVSECNPDMPTEILISLAPDVAGALLREYCLDNIYETEWDFEWFSEAYRELLGMLEEVEGTTLFDSIYRATFDFHYSKKHYKAATYKLPFKIINSLEWSYCQSTSRIDKHYVNWALKPSSTGHAFADLLGDEGSQAEWISGGPSDDQLDDDNHDPLIDTYYDSDEEEDRWYMREYFGMGP